MQIDHPELEILLPVYNEAGSIEKVIREIYAELSKKVRCQFIICEDGSQDNSKEIICRLSSEIPMQLILSAERKGYSRAVKDGMLALSADYLLCLDSDGQCDPGDFWRFWESREAYDMILGWRQKRHDPAWRFLFSRTFYSIYQLFFHVPFHDPSCPFMLAKKSVVADIAPKMGEMQQGYWWEFSARVCLSGYKNKEIPVHHRDRFSGKTQVYRLNKVAHIGYYHFLALFKISAQMNHR